MRCAMKFVMLWTHQAVALNVRYLAVAHIDWNMFQNYFFPHEFNPNLIRIFLIRFSTNESSESFLFELKVSNCDFSPGFIRCGIKVYLHKEKCNSANKTPAHNHQSTVDHRIQSENSTETSQVSLNLPKYFICFDFRHFNGTSLTTNKSQFTHHIVNSLFFVKTC